MSLKSLEREIEESRSRRGFDLLVQVSTNLDTGPTITMAPASEYYETNAHLYPFLDRALALGIAVPEISDGIYILLLESVYYREGIMAMVKRGDWLGMEGHWRESARSHADAIVLHCAAWRAEGGRCLIAMGSSSGQGMAVERLRSVMSLLSSEDLRQLIARLDSVHSQCDSVEAMVQGSRTDFTDALGAGWEGVSEYLRDLPDRPEHNRQMKMVFNRMVVRREMLILELAVTLYRREHGRFPATLEEAAAIYLNGKYVDPFSPVRGGYRYLYLEEIGTLIYSVGPDGDDDGGRLIKQGTWRQEAPDGDLVRGDWW